MEFPKDEFYSKRPIVLKIILTGPSNSGKSCIMSRFTNDSFFTHEHQELGINFDCKTIKISDKLIQLQIWDASGKEKYQSKILPYYGKSNAVLIIFDKSSFESFSSLEKFFRQVEDYGSTNSAIFLVGNKTDLESNFSFEAVHEFALRFNTIYVEVSACTAQNINLLLELVAEETLKKQFDNQKIRFELK